MTDVSRPEEHDMVQRYVAAVKSHLPKEGRDDIARELADGLDSRLEERALALGRPLAGAEVAAMLKDLGHPLLVAGRYLPVQYLVGPTLLPLWWLALRRALIAVVMLHLVLGVLALLADGNLIGAAIRVAIGAAETVVFVIGALTVAAALAEHYAIRPGFLDDWRPEQLAPVQDRWRVDPGDVVTDFVTAGVFLLWWVGVIGVPAPTWGDGQTLRAVLSPAWSALYVPLIVLASLDIGLAVVNLARMRWSRFRLALHAVSALAWLAAIGWLLQADTLVMLTAAAGEPVTPTPQALQWLERGIRYSLVVIGGFTAWDCVSDATKLARGADAAHAERHPYSATR